MFTRFQKIAPLIVANNFGKCRLVFKILSMTVSQENYFYRVFRLTLLHCLAKLKHLK